MKQPLISVVIPLYNKEKWVKRCVESVLDQTYSHMEILIVNDGSTDNSLQVVETIEDNRIKIINKPNGGVSSARNLGIEHAKGEYIAFLDADDEWEPKHLDILLEGFERFKDAIVVCDDLVELRNDESKKEIQRRNLPFDTSKSNTEEIQYFPIEDYLQTLGDDCFILSGSSVLIKASVIRKHQLRFYENMTLGEDVNYWIQLSQYGKFVFCDYLGLIYHRADEQSAMNRKKQIAELTPNYFHGLTMSNYNVNEIKNIKKFLSREYYKKAYQNRGSISKKEEFLGKIGDTKIGWGSVILYLSIRFCPEFIFSVYRKVKTYKRERMYKESI